MSIPLLALFYNLCRYNWTILANPEIISIGYNQLNLPASIDKTGGNYVQYQYDAAGNKRRQLEYKNGLLFKTTGYVANFVYIKGKIAWNIFDEGRIAYNINGTISTETYLKE